MLSKNLSDNNDPENDRSDGNLVDSSMSSNMSSNAGIVNKGLGHIKLLPFEPKYTKGCMAIYNEIVLEGLAFPKDSLYELADFKSNYLSGDPVWCAVGNNDEVLGFVHIHPNNIGRCSHIANCGYAVAASARGKGVGRKLLAKSIEVIKDEGYIGIQFNAVVATNKAAIALYKSFGFEIIGTIPNGFRFGSADDPQYVDMHIMFKEV